MPKDERGFTLVEVLVAMTVFAFGVLAVVNMQLLSAQVNVKARGMTEAIVAAQSQVERLSALAYSDPLLADSGADGAGGMNNTDATAGDPDHSNLADPKYNLFWNVRDDFPFANTKTIRVLVRWSERGVPVVFSVDMVKSEGA